MNPNLTNVTRYQYNGRGERVLKYRLPAAPFYAVYDSAGQVLGDYDTAGANSELRKEIIWLDDTPIAVIHEKGAIPSGGDYAFIHTDHLNTPRALVKGPSDKGSGDVIWRWRQGQDAFGEQTAEQDPDGDSANYDFRLRFPGQQYDSESGLHYNYFRDYESASGRYLQSDSIGLAGGSATYAYVGSAPILFSDETGEARKFYCDKVTYSTFRHSIDNFCPGKPGWFNARSCDAGMNCAIAAMYHNRFLVCISARMAMQNFCYRKSAYDREINNLWNGVKKCSDVARTCVDCDDECRRAIARSAQQSFIIGITAAACLGAFAL